MNLIEAIKSGKPHKRKSWKTFLDTPVRVPGFNSIQFELDDLLADDWEIQEPTFAVTRKQVDEAFLSIMEWTCRKKKVIFPDSSSSYEAFAKGYKILGLEP